MKMKWDGLRFIFFEICFEAILKSPLAVSKYMKCFFECKLERILIWIAASWLEISHKQIYV